jgi:mono/diheme cytochrome c family protein
MSSRVDELWKKACAECHGVGGVPLEIFAQLLRDLVRGETLEEAAREVESVVFESKYYAALRIRKLKGT